MLELIESSKKFFLLLAYSDTTKKVNFTLMEVRSEGPIEGHKTPQPQISGRYVTHQLKSLTVIIQKRRYYKYHAVQVNVPMNQ